MAILFKKGGGTLSKSYIKKARKKPGGSNVGKYKGVKSFAGPSGGAPKGSYPINSVKRAKSALKLAHNAPNPSGIKSEVYRKYPGLKKDKKCGGKIKNCGGILKYQTGDKSPYIYSSVEELASKSRYGKIKKYAPSGITRCTGMTKDACNPEEDLRGTLDRAFLGAKRNPGDSDNVVDAWDVLNTAYNSDEFDVLYDRAVDSPEKLEKLISEGRIPLNALISTGDARDRGEGDIRTGRTESGRRSFVSGKDRNPHRVSRHAIINLGFTKDGSPIIYDLGKFSKGIPSKYKGEINSVVVKSANKRYFRQKEENITPLESRGVTEVESPEEETNVEEIVKKKPIIIVQAPQHRFANRIISLINTTFNLS